MKGKKYTIYTIVTTLLKEAGLAIIALWLLPRLGIYFPLWGVVLVMVVVAAWDWITYRICKKTLDQESLTPSSAMIGCEGRVTMPLDPEGVVQIRGELWKAQANCPIGKDEAIIVRGIEGLALLVAPLSNNGRTEETDSFPG